LKITYETDDRARLTVPTVLSWGRPSFSAARFDPQYEKEHLCFIAAIKYIENSSIISQI
jgi:hypothetical protein